LEKQGKIALKGSLKRKEVKGETNIQFVKFIEGSAKALQREHRIRREMQEGRGEEPKECNERGWSQT